MSRRSLIIAAEGAAILIGVLAARLGSHEFVGSFGASGESKSCGSVWGLPGTDDLNAASCQSNLRDRLALVAALVGIAGVLALVTPMVALRESGAPRRRVAIVLALVIPLTVAIAMVALGRHRIWSISGA